MYCCKTEETCIWHERCPDGTFLTRHCVAMAWFPHEPIDAVTYSLQSREQAWEHWIQGAIAQQNAQKTHSLNHVSDQKWKLHLKRRWIPLVEFQLQENPLQESPISLWIIFLEQVGNEMEQGVLTRLRKDSKLVQRIGINGPYIEVRKTRPLMSWRRSQWIETRLKTSIALLQCIQCTEDFWDR